MSNNNNNIAYMEDKSSSSIGSRIAKIATLVGGKKILATKVNISESQLYRYINNESQPTAQPLVAIANAGDVSLDWLIAGKPSAKDAHIENNRQDIFTEITTFDTPGYHAPNKVLFSLAWLEQHSLQAESLRLLPMLGDSMSPTINEHDLLVVDSKQTQVETDAIFVLQMDEKLVAKRLQHAVDGGIYISSDNPRYREQHVVTTELNIVGRVVWHGRFL